MQLRSKYIQKLEELDGTLTELAEKSIADVRAAGRALAGEEGVADQVLAGNKAGHRLRNAIEDGCLDIMLMQQPLVADDLREVSATFRVVSDLAHIDEMTRDVAYLSQQLTPKAVSHLEAEFADATERVAVMIETAMKAFNESDLSLVQKVYEMDDAVDDLYDKAEQVIVDLIREGKSGAKHLPELLMVAKYFERMGDDAQRIADWAHFRATGEHAVHSRDEKQA
jgi:phosphate transport system protein